LWNRLTKYQIAEARHFDAWQSSERPIADSLREYETMFGSNSLKELGKIALSLANPATLGGGGTWEGL
jgi:hypothetical protein